MCNLNIPQGNLLGVVQGILSLPGQTVSMENLHIESHPVPGGTIMILAGVLTQLTAPTLDSRIPDSGSLVIDLDALLNQPTPETPLTLDGGLLTVLLKVGQVLNERGDRLAVFSSNPSFHSFIEDNGVATTFLSAQDRVEALRSIGVE